MDATLQTNDIAEISTHANAAFRIHDLPPETFIHALLCLRDIDRPVRVLSSDEPIPETRLGWINTTHVSKYWRESILSCPLFWTRIPFDLGQTWTSAFMTRCRSMPIVIRLGDLEPARWIRTFMPENFHRTRCLDIGQWAGAVRTDHDPIYALLEQSSTMLQTLYLDRPWRKLEHPRLRSPQYPQLRTLHLRFLAMYAEDFPWRVIGPTALTDLSITLERPLHIDRILGDVIYCLQQLPTLSTLELVLTGLDKTFAIGGGNRRDVRDSDREVDHNPVPCIYCPNLEKFTLKARTEEVVPILRHVTFPTSTLLTLFSSDLVERETYSSTLHPLIYAHSNVNSFQGILVDGARDFDCGWQIRATSSIGTIPRDNPFRNRRDVRLCMNVSPVSNMFYDVISSIRPETIHAVDINSTLNISLNNDLMLPCIRTLCQNAAYISFNQPEGMYNDRHATAPGILAAILRRLLLPGSGGTHTVPFPKLVALDLTCANVFGIASRCVHPEDGKSRMSMPPTFAQTLADIMSVRRNTGAHMPRVYLWAWKTSGTQFEMSVLDIMLAIPEVEFLPSGSRIILDESSGGVKNL